MALAHATVLLHFIILKNSYCTETNTALDHVTVIHFCVGFSVWFLKMWLFPYAYVFCNPVRIYRGKIHMINTHLMSFQSWFGVLSRSSHGWCLNERATNCASMLTGMDQSTHRHRLFSLLIDTTQVGVKSVTFHCEYLDNEGKCRFYIICITFCIDSWLLQNFHKIRLIIFYSSSYELTSVVS